MLAEITVVWQVYQDVCFPADSLSAALSKSDELFRIYPLLLYPCRLVDRGGMVRVRPSTTSGDSSVEGSTRSSINLNLGALVAVPPLHLMGNCASDAKRLVKQGSMGCQKSFPWQRQRTRPLDKNAQLQSCFQPSPKFVSSKPSFEVWVGSSTPTVTLFRCVSNRLNFTIIPVAVPGTIREI
eukprot:COSAG02_NODE_5193_length_4551_cov_21.421833_5_plen_182_part_00